MTKTETHFGSKIASALARKGIEVVGTEFLPRNQRSEFNDDTVYIISNKGQREMWTWNTVRTIGLAAVQEEAA